MSEQRQVTENAGGYSKSRLMGLFLGAGFLLMTVFLSPPASMSLEAWSALGLMLLMATWWSTEAIPIPATALLPVVLVPGLGLGSISQASSPYAHPIIFLFLGGFTLGLAMQRWNLHRRIALMTLKAVGNEPKRQIAGFMLATAFLSMWVSNTATAIMMLPIGLSVIGMMGNGQSENVQRYATALLLAIAYSASIGGIATLIGTPPNALLAAYLNETQGISVGFAQWMLLGVPVALVMLGLIWWWLTRKDFGLIAQEGAGQAIRDELSALGPMGRGEKLVALVFVLTASAWVFRPLILASIAPWLTDTGIAISAAIAMFIIPVDTRRQIFLLDWDTAKGIPWGVLLLFGGGLAMAGVISSSGLADWIAASMGVASALPVVVMIVLVVAVIIFLTEVTSNTATAAAFLPLLGALALSQGASPLLLTVPAAIAASCAFMMPVATPPNAIVFSSGHMKIGDMIRAGFALNIAGIVVVTLLCYLFLDLIFTI
ncbi:solute carrier family 13 (sodium-dependent dicarboxylate transporter), member 2/3/5 [Marinobacter antarcticus]|uniref:Solute carrier family 13 (Sodium-dependent dicarboxylate transporter), member 2/3/5 n=1 Tax=Marinobacter antarcticus TaxID=564117 RepID=A0A1M6SDJ0_9GAMM|nr:DASS family sodium-coupled anion symporter [Marinobacter antarcticus]SHK42801.1 solute carrier family 13 (sodium-dependent dicarboxylate transporter), member 2/3/5 [Marinobacter antarcticus]